jgi:predicted AAA+ superfamily ATPase
MVAGVDLRLEDKRLELRYSWGGHNGPSLDLMCFKGGKRMGFEVKHQDAPRLSKGLLAALEILKLDDFKIVYLGTMRYALHEKNEVVPLEQWLCEKLAGDEG